MSAVEIKNRLVAIAQWDTLAQNPLLVGGALSVVRTAAGLYDVTLNAKQVWDTIDPRGNSIVPLAVTYVAGDNVALVVQQLVGGDVLKIVATAAGVPTDLAGAVFVFGMPTVD